MPRFILSVLLLLFVGTIVNAEQISLKNGDRLSGAIVSMDGKKLVLIPRREVNLKIHYISEDYREDLINHCAGAARALIVIRSSFSSKSEIRRQFKSKDDGGNRSRTLF